MPYLYSYMARPNNCSCHLDPASSPSSLKQRHKWQACCDYMAV